MPKVSICIPVYGVEKYIERCVRSLFGQTLDSIEYVFVDDCSPDNSIAVMQKVLEEYPQRKDQIKIIRHEVNQGLVAARNHGVAACTGDYIIHCDSDDWVDLELYEKMYKQAVFFDADIVCAPFIIEGAAGNDGHKVISPQTAVDVEDYIIANLGRHLNSLWSKLYRKEIAQCISLICPTHICMGEDLLRNIQMLDKCKTIAFVNDVCYHYFRGNTTALTRTLSRNYFEQFKEVAELLSDIRICKFPDFYSVLQAQVLFAALKTENISSSEFRSIYPAEVYSQVLKLKNIVLWKRFLLAIAMLSYPLAKCFCRLLIKIHFC